MRRTDRERQGYHRGRWLATIASLALIAAPAALADDGGVSGGGGGSTPNTPGDPYCTVSGSNAKIVAKGKACAPVDAPKKVKDVIAGGNKVRNRRYQYGGGHSWNWHLGKNEGLDCSGSVSHALHRYAGWLAHPLPSGSFKGWGQKGYGRWITVFANGGHAYMKVAGLRWDTSMTGGSGPSWSSQMRSSSGFSKRHPTGY